MEVPGRRFGSVSRQKQKSEFSRRRLCEITYQACKQVQLCALSTACDSTITHEKTDVTDAIVCFIRFVPIWLRREASSDDALVDGGMLRKKFRSINGPFEFACIEGVTCGDGCGWSLFVRHVIPKWVRVFCTLCCPVVTCRTKGGRGRGGERGRGSGSTGSLRGQRFRGSLAFDLCHAQ